MFNNINDNNSLLYNSQFENKSNVINMASIKANLNKSLFNKRDSLQFVDKSEISANALELFQKDLDVKNFNKIAMSDPDDFSHLEKMKELFNSGVVDVFEDDVIESLVTNSKLLDDLEL